MPYDEKGRYWPEYRDGVYSDGVTNYKPPPDEDDNPPQPWVDEKKEVS